MKVISAQTMQEIDGRTIREHGIPGISLMESAGAACVREILSSFGTTGRAVVVGGKGNNGGDGFVIARLLSRAGWNVAVLLLAERSDVAGDAAANLGQLPPEIIECIPSGECFSSYHRDILLQADLIVDAMLGTGLNNTLGGVYLEAVRRINESSRPVVAVDIPSGIHGSSGKVLGDAVRASVTVTFACAKLGHVLYPGAGFTGRLVVADIGIPPAMIEEAEGCQFLTAEDVRTLVRRRNPQSHKGHFGHCLIIAASPGKTGAAALSANSAVRTGSGLVTLAVPESLNSILEAKTTEAMTVPLPDSGSGHLTNLAFPAIEKLLDGKDAVALGPGIDRRPGTTALVQTLIASISAPLVIDADGLNALAEDMNALRGKRTADIVLTPHPGEMARLLGISVAEVEADRISVASDFARRYDVHLVLKGARTIIAAPSGAIAINGTGNPGMASGGMGDVLTGIVVSLLGQGYTCWDACRLGVFIHGYAADLVAHSKGEIGMNATDVQEMLPYALHRLL